MANTLQTDINGVLYEGVRDPIGQRFVAKQAGSVTTDGGGVLSAPEMVAMSAFTDATTSGALAAANATVTLACGGGQATALFQITGTFVGTVLFQASADGGTTWVALEAVSGVTVGTSTTTTGDWFANIAGYTNVRAEMSPYTSGSATVRLNLSAQPQVVTLANAQPLGQQLSASSSSVVVASDQIVPIKQSFTEVLGQSPTVVNGNNTLLFPSTDVSAYKSLSLQLSGTWAMTLNFEASNDNVSWYPTMLMIAGAAGGNSTQTSITSQDNLLYGLVCFRYFRVRASGWSSNTSLVGTLELYTDALPIPLVTVDTVSIPYNNGGLYSHLHLVAAASNNATNVKSSSGQVYSWTAYNSAAAARYLKLYDKATTPAPATDTPRRTLGIPPGGSLSFESPVGFYFNNGIGIAIVGGIADTDNTSVALNDVVVDIDYV